MTWSAITDAFDCTTIAIDANQITAGTLNSARLPVVPLTKGGTGLSGAGAANQIIGMDSAGTAAEFKSLTAGSNITITHSAGGIQIDSSNGGGTVTNIATGAGLTGGPITGAGTIALATSGASAGTYGSATQVPQVTVDTYGRVTAVSAVTITGTSPVGSALTTGQVWVGDGSNVAAARTLKITDIASTVAGNWMTAAGACANGSHLEYSAVSDNLSCLAYTLTPSQVTTALGFTPANGTNYVAKAGDTMTGTLNLPSNGLTVGTSQMVVSSGNVGIGTTGPIRPLHVRGGSIRQVNGVDGNDGIEWASQDGTRRLITYVTPSYVRFQAETASTKMLFAVNGADRMLIDTSGNVGIGTTSPSAKLSIQSDLTTNFNDGLEIKGTSNLYGPTIGLNNTGTSGREYLIISNGASNVGGAGSLMFYDKTTGGGTGARMVINSSGNVGINTTSPSEKLHIVGNLRVQGSTDCTLGNGSGGTNCTSDIRLKTNVQEIENPLEKILSLRGVEFDWNEKSQSPGEHAIGVIAQDVEKQFPTAVIEDSSTGYKKVDYAVLIAPVIQAFKELNKRITELFSASERHSREIASVKAEKDKEIAELRVRADKAEAEAAKQKQENAETKARLDKIEKMLKSK